MFLEQFLVEGWVLLSVSPSVILFSLLWSKDTQSSTLGTLPSKCSSFLRQFSHHRFNRKPKQCLTFVHSINQPVRRQLVWKHLPNIIMCLALCYKLMKKKKNRYNCHPDRTYSLVGAIGSYWSKKIIKELWMLKATVSPLIWDGVGVGLSGNIALKKLNLNWDLNKK